MYIVITNGTLIDPANNLDAARDLLIEDGVVRAVDQPGSFNGA